MGQSLQLQNVLVFPNKPVPPQNDYPINPYSLDREVCLDIEVANAMAPGLSKIIVYEAPNDSQNTSSGWDAMLDTMANENTAKQLSCSWGANDYEYDPIADQIFQQMIAQGQSFFQASGDDGGYTLTKQPTFPCDNPYITIVGGTSLTTNADTTWSSETTWNDSPNSSGGGNSFQYAIPPWQYSITNSNPQVSTSMRNIPDVALTADNIYVRLDNSVDICVGTSAAAPLWAGFTALINQQAIASGKPTVGFLNWVLYEIGKVSTTNSDFHDINDMSSNGPFNAYPGYDLCTGWGTPTGQALINDVINLKSFNVTVYQKYLSQMPADSIARWVSPSFVKYKAPATNLQFYLGKNEVLRGTQKVISGQKYNNWNGLPDVTNQHTFIVLTENDPFVSNLLPTYNATIQAQGDGATLGSVWFQDPWLVDSSDVSHGGALMNRGMSAIFKSVAYVQNNVGLTSRDSGVFLKLGGIPPNLTPPYYSVSFPSQTVPIGGTNHALYFLNWAQSGAGFANSSNDTTGVIFDSANATVTANIKGTQLSQNPSAFANSSQRKFIQTPNGWLHMVYESMGHVWIEHSRDSGKTWQLNVNPNNYRNNVCPVDTGGGGKCPSLDYLGNTVMVAYQQNSGNNYKIFLQSFMLSADGTHYFTYMSDTTIYPLYGETTDSYSTNANPNISLDAAYNAFVVTFERKGSVPGIYYITGGVYPNGILNNSNGLPAPPVKIGGTDANSINASISNLCLGGNTDYAIAWQEYVSSGSSSIKYCYLQDFSNSFSQYDTTQNKVSNSSYPNNHNPSIIILNDGSFRVYWIGDDGNGEWMTTNSLERNPSTSTIYELGAGVTSVSMNRTNNAANYYLAYCEDINGEWMNMCSPGSTLSQGHGLTTTGQNIQLCNGPASTNMYASAYYPFTLPYYFQMSQSLGSVLGSNAIIAANSVSKAKAISQANAVSTTSTVPAGRGRGVAVDKGNTGFYYSIGNIMLDGNLIDFVSADNKAHYDSLNVLNNVLLSQPFTLKSNSVFSFSEKSGAADSAAAAKVLGSQGYISFIVQLIDNTSGSVIGTIRQQKFSPANLQPYKMSSYTFPATGLGGTTGRLKITFGTNVDSLRLTLMEEYTGVNLNALGQASPLTMQTPSPTGVSLGNYPNPFNPTTNISYQLVENSHVSIKVYDILGRQITTLVEGNKTAGQYTAVFDGSHYASGVYFVRMMVQGASSKQLVKTLKIQMLK